MNSHPFLFQAGHWIGEGKVSFSVSPEILRFYTRWTVQNPAPRSIACEQRVEIQGNEPYMLNQFLLTEITEKDFIIDLENEVLGQVRGTGVIDPKNIAWEFHGRGGLEGFEIYELQENGEYTLHAEYTSPDQFRTIIDGRIRKQLE